MATKHITRNIHILTCHHRLLNSSLKKMPQSSITLCTIITAHTSDQMLCIKRFHSWGLMSLSNKRVRSCDKWCGGRKWIHLDLLGVQHAAKGHYTQALFCILPTFIALWPLLVGSSSIFSVIHTERQCKLPWQLYIRRPFS